MYRLSMLLILAASSVIILSGCSKSTEPETPKPPYFSSTGLSYPKWHDTGSPEGILPELSLSQKMNYKSRAYFYNRMPSDVLQSMVLSQIPDGYTGDEGVPVLDVVYDPSIRGTNNYTPDLTDPAKCWGGLQRLVSKDEVDIDGNFDQIQMWMQIEETDPKGAKLYIDLGRISEDVIPNLRYDTEDRNANGLLEPGEDYGLDGKPDQQEPNYNVQTNPDPSGDNYFYYPLSLDYLHLNGTENNAISLDYGKLPDTEDLDANHYLELRNDFFRYEITLDSLNTDKYFTIEKGRNGWFKIIIPVYAFKSGVGYPMLRAPFLMRLWFSGVKSRIHLRFAELRLTSQ
jgi:hypothetical protein